MLGAALGGTQVAVALEHLADIPAVPDGRGGHQNGCLLRRTTLPGQHAHQSWALAGWSPRWTFKVRLYLTGSWYTGSGQYDGGVQTRLGAHLLH